MSRGQLPLFHPIIEVAVRHRLVGLCEFALWHFHRPCMSTVLYRQMFEVVNRSRVPVTRHTHDCAMQILHYIDSLIAFLFLFARVRLRLVRLSACLPAPPRCVL